MYSKYMLPFYADGSLFKKEKYLEVALFLVIDDFTDGKFPIQKKKFVLYFRHLRWGKSFSDIHLLSVDFGSK